MRAAVGFGGSGVCHATTIAQTVNTANTDSLCYTEHMAPRKQAERTYRKRLTIELLAEEESFVREMRGRAISRGTTLRDWVLEAMREKAKRDERH